MGAVIGSFVGQPMHRKAPPRRGLPDWDWRITRLWLGWRAGADTFLVALIEEGRVSRAGTGF
jgi:hypothetical protein